MHNIGWKLATPLKEFYYEPSSHPLVVLVGFFWSDVILKVFDKCSKRKKEHITATCRHSDMLPVVWNWKAVEWEPLTMVNVFSWIPSKSFQTGRMLMSKRRPGGLRGLPEAGSVHKHQPEEKLGTTASSFCVKYYSGHMSGFHITTNVSGDGDDTKRLDALARAFPSMLFGCQQMLECAGNFQRRTSPVYSIAPRNTPCAAACETLQVSDSWGVKSRKDEKKQNLDFQTSKAFNPGVVSNSSRRKSFHFD